MKIGICIILISLTLLAILYIALQNNVDKKQKLRKQLSCNHDFKYKQNVWGHEGDVLMHQYECTKCGRKDYLISRDDPDKDWNHGMGDGKLCDIDRQEYVRN